MKTSQTYEKNALLGNGPLDEAQKKLVFNLMKAQVVRSRVTMTAVFLAAYPVNGEQPTPELEAVLDQFMIKNIRQTDVLIAVGPFARCLFLSHTREAEAAAFLHRLLRVFEEEYKTLPSLTFAVTMAEVKNRKVQYEDLITLGKEKLIEAKNRQKIEIIDSFQEREIEKIKVSILESDPIFSNVLKTSLEQLSFPYFDMEIMQFSDGYEFLESEFILSGHSHIVITDDILPRTNGLKVVHTLRQMPNQRKFTIFMMTKRQTEADMLYAYQAGVDQYLIKPFNIRLFEAQIKRTFERFWS